MKKIQSSISYETKLSLNSIQIKCVTHTGLFEFILQKFGLNLRANSTRADLFLVSWGHSLTQLNSKIGSAWLGSSKILVRICRNSLKTLWFPGCKLMNYKIHISTIICYRCKNIRKCLRVWRRNSKVIQSKFMAAVCGYQSLHTLDSSNHQPFNLHPDFWNSRSWEIMVYFKP